VVKRAGEGQDVFEAKGEVIKFPAKSSLQLCIGANDPTEDDEEAGDAALSSAELTDLK